MISCIVPAFNEEQYISKTLDSLVESAKRCNSLVEIIVVNNHSLDRTAEVVSRYRDRNVRCLYYPVMGREHAKNFGAEIARGQVLAFVDADCTVSPNFFQEIEEKAKNPHFIGGGMKYVKTTRLSFGILCALVPIAIALILNQITVGAFWVRKGAFGAIGGFRVTTWDDIDFAIRLKRYAKEQGKKFESIKKARLIWSTRKFDDHGDFAWLWKARQMRNATI